MLYIQIYVYIKHADMRCVHALLTLRKKGDIKDQLYCIIYIKDTQRLH